MVAASSSRSARIAATSSGWFDVLLAGQPALAGVGRHGPLVGPADHLLVLRFEVVGDPQQLGNRHLSLTRV